MSPIGPLSIILIVIINYINGYSIQNTSTFTKDLHKGNIKNYVIEFNISECDPGHYESSTGICVKCKDYDAKCTKNEECCLREYTKCSSFTNQCVCIDDYIWSRPTAECYESMTTLEIMLTLLASFIICFAVALIIYCFRSPTKRFCEYIRERRSARISDETDGNFTLHEPPQVTNNDRPLTLRELFVRQQSTNTLPSPVTAYPPPEYAIQPEFYLNDQPPDYNDIPISPPPNYIQAVGFQYPVVNNDSTLPNISSK